MNQFIFMGNFKLNKAVYLRDYRIKFYFYDGVEQVIDFASFLNNAKIPRQRNIWIKLFFQKYTIEYGDIIWNDYEMCFPVWDLHQGNI